MISSKDLMIGNWVEWDNEAKYIIKGIGNKGARFENDHGQYRIYNRINPIPLTPEILEKCGFVKKGEWAVLNFPVRAGIRFYNFNYAECDLIQDDKFIAFKNSHIKYLHQLQNLFYCLCGKELDVNL